MGCYSPPPARGGRGWGRWAVPPQKPSSPNPLLQRRRGLCSCDSSHPLAEGAGFDVATPLRPLAGGGGGSATSPSSPNPLLQRRRGLCSCDSPHPLAGGEGFDAATPLRPLAGGGAGGGGGSATNPLLTQPSPPEEERALQLRLPTSARGRSGLRCCHSPPPACGGRGWGRWGFRHKPLLTQPSPPEEERASQLRLFTSARGRSGLRCCYSPPPACGGRGWGRWVFAARVAC